MVCSRIKCASVPILPNLTGIPTWTYGPDGEGRVSTVSASTGTNPVSGTSYNGFSQPTSVIFGSSDGDDFVYDGNTGRMTQYQATISGSSMTGAPSWKQQLDSGIADDLRPVQLGKRPNLQLHARRSGARRER